ncbi:MAG TPA: PfkB family carbohydrate kinase [Acidobacteriaceae bacterium]|jgi:fructokinase|nr:PfkB family carbohydrate kinase [Acidobacteriaceae bacterium]
MADANTEQRVVVGLGELLWDLLPEGARLGGAPANFAVMAGRLGNRAVVASRVGADALGEKARLELEGLPVESGALQADAEYATGTVTVVLQNHEPEYTIHEPVAWDRLALTPEWRELARTADAVCFGTLAQRAEPSRATILGFLDATRPECVRVFDVNMRVPFWSGDVLRDSLGRTTILKLNAGELRHVLMGTGVCPYPVEAQDDDAIMRGAERLLERYAVDLVCITLGARGSLLVTRKDHHRHAGLAAAVQDTVGAGDAFTAALTHYYLEGAPLAVLNEAGNRWGAWVASQAGGMPPMRAETLKKVSGEIRAKREQAAKRV